MEFFLTVLLELVLSYFIADFLQGVVHWAEDGYLTPRMPKWIVKNVMQPNRLHHIYPRKTAHTSDWMSFVQTVIPGVLIYVVLVLPFIGIGRMFFFILLFGYIGNLLHKWNHQKPHERPKYLKVFQDLKLLQSAKEHGVHHLGQTDAGYCVFTPHLNPILDKINFWRGLEKIIFKMTGIRANGPEEPYKFYRMENSEVLEFQLDTKQWLTWPDKKLYDMPVKK